MPEATIISTVYNEESTIIDLLDSIVGQNRTPSEVIIVDGGSTDTTVDKILSYSRMYEFIKLVEYPGCNISEGRNKAISEATCDYIVSTDGGCVLDQDWYGEMCAAFSQSEYVAGLWEPAAEGIFERVQSIVISDNASPKEFKNGNRGPSSRSVGFSVDLWDEVGGYPEKLYTGEDSKFNAKVLSAGYDMAVAENAVVYWKMRKNRNELWNQFFNYGKGDAEAGNLLIHPNKRLGVAKSFWLALSASTTIVSFLTFILSIILFQEVLVYVGVICVGLFLIPMLYHHATLVESYSKLGIEGPYYAIPIIFTKYWGWYFGFVGRIFHSPQLIIHQFSEFNEYNNIK